MRKPIENGTIIRLNEVGTDKKYDFKIKEMIGMGGSCIVYTAVYTDPENNRFYVRLKELYPEWLDIERESLAISVPDEKSSDFAEAMQQFTEGYKKQIQFRELPESMNSIANIQGIYKGNNTKYIAMSCQNAVPLSADMSLYDIFRVIRAVALQISGFHDNGYLYLDLKPQNVMLYPETPEMVMLFDFDSAVPIDDIRPAHLSCTDSWAPPEILQHKFKDIDVAADIYGIGALLLYLLFGRAPKISDRRRGASWDNEIENSLLKTEKPEIKRTIKGILSLTLAADPKKRYSSCDDLLDVIEPLVTEYQKPKPYLKTFLPMGNNFFCGRDNEISEIHEALTENDLLVLHGIGGIGKSELAKHYALSYAVEYDAVVFVRFRDNMIDTITMDSNFPVANCIRSEDEDDEEYFERKVNVLQEICTPRHLIILDNFDTDKCDNLDVLLGLSCKILITSRVDQSDTFPQYEVNAIENNDDLRSVIIHYYNTDINDTELSSVDNIISAVQGHTMALELIAKHMYAMEITPSEMYDMLAEQGITASDNGKVRGFKDGNLKSSTAYSHISILFNIFDLSEDMKQILRYEALVGPTPISASDFGMLIRCTKEQGDILDELIILGWIQCYVVDDDPIITLHPLISDVLCEELKPNAEQCEDFLISATGFATDILDNEADERKKHISWLLHIAHNIYGDSTAITFFFHNLMEYVLLPAYDYTNVEWCSLRIIQILDNLGLQDEYKLAYLDSYIHLIKVAEAKGNATLATEYEQKISTLKTSDAMIQLASEKCIDAYTDGRMEVAKKAGQEWLEIALKANNHEETAHAYYMLGQIISDDNNLSYEYFQKAVQYLMLWIRDLEADEEHIEEDLIHAYKLIAYAYSLIDNLDSSLKFYNKAIDLTIEEHNDMSGNLITLYIEMSDIYQKLSDTDNQIKYLEKAVEISEYVYGKYHEETAKCYTYLIEAYPDYENDSEQLFFTEKCAEISAILIDIYTQIAGECSEDVRSWQKCYAYYLHLLDQKEKCCLILEKMISLYQTIPYSPDSEWIDSYYVAAWCFKYFDEYEKARELLQKAIEMCQELDDMEQLSECKNLLEEL